jgi:hypothetical protein
MAHGRFRMIEPMTIRHSDQLEPRELGAAPRFLSSHVSVVLDQLEHQALAARDAHPQRRASASDRDDSDRRERDACLVALTGAVTKRLTEAGRRNGCCAVAALQHLRTSAPHIRTAPDRTDLHDGVQLDTRTA